MRKFRDFFDTTYEMFSEAERHGLMYNQMEEGTLDGRLIHLNDREMVSFSSCSYLGLEVDSRLKMGAIDAVMRYGAQFSCSRAYLSIPLYGELEGLLEEIFGLPVQIAQTTSLAHQSALPLLLGEEDAAILDQQVHFSVRNATQLARVQGTTVEIVRHSRLDLLEEKILSLRNKHQRIWYLVDGLYSMFGDFVPVDGLKALMAKYEQLHLYVDDAHAMSWYGEHGRGFALSHLASERVVVATSLAKAFGVVGGVLLIPDERLRRQVLRNSSPMIYSGPIQPANLGAAVASAHIHLSPELADYQLQLRQRMQLCNRLMAEARVPLVALADAPIRFVGLGLPRVAYDVATSLKADGYFVDISTFPLVPMQRAGIRFTLTNHQTEADIRGLVSSFARHVPEALERHGSSLEAVRTEFGLAVPQETTLPLVERPVEIAATPPVETHSHVPCIADRPLKVLTAPPTQPDYRLQRASSIEALDQAEWDQLLGANGSFGAGGMRFLEQTFQGRPRPTDNWAFHYVIVRDASDHPILATFFTDSLWKDDMLASKVVSQLAEARRVTDPTFLCSRVIALGSQLTEGQHLYLDRTANWQAAVGMLLEEMEKCRAEVGATRILLRDLPADDAEMDQFMLSQGFTRHEMSPTLALDLDWVDDAEWLARFPSKKRGYLKRALALEPSYRTEILGRHGRMPTSDELAQFHNLYRQVKGRALTINTFDLPEDIFARAVAQEPWELQALYLRPDGGGEPDSSAVAIGAAYIGPEHYAPIFLGLDYRYVYTHGAYRQALLQVIRRARSLGKQRVLFGMGATLEKQRYGANIVPACYYVRATENYQIDVLAELMADAALYPQL